MYVDNLTLTGNDNRLLHKFINQLSAKFSINDLGKLSYFISVEVLPTKHGILLSQ